MDEEINFINSGVISPFDSAIPDLGANLVMFGSLEYGADAIKMGMTNQLVDKRMATSLRSRMSPTSMFGKIKDFGSNIITGSSHHDRILGAAYEASARDSARTYDKWGQSHDIKKGPVKIGHRFRATKAMFGNKALAEGIGSKTLIRSLAMKEVGASLMGGMSRIGGAAMILDLGKLAMFASGAIDMGGIYEQRGRMEIQSKFKSANQTRMTNGFYDNSGAATMRQRGLAAIHNTQMNIQQVFGAEASYVHS